jgi:hypothetical protein
MFNKREYSKKYNLEHKEEMAAKAKKRREEHPEYVIKYRKEHKEERAVAAKRRREEHPEYGIKYREEHKIERNNKSKIYHLENKEQIVLKKREYRLKHKNEISKYKFENKEEIKKYRKEYYLKNKNKIIEQVINWNKANPAKIRSYKNKKRFNHKDWTSIPFNTFFEGAVGHHYDKFHIIWIPEPLHKSFWHDLEKGTNMDKINAWAFAWYEGLV